MFDTKKSVKYILGDDDSDDFIRKIPGKREWKVFSESGKNMGKFPSHGLAMKRLEQIEYFSRRK